MQQNIPRPEHPFPQMERSTWHNLNGTWDFAFDFGKSGLERGFGQKTEWEEEKIIVPFCPESTLSGIGHTDFIPSPSKPLSPVKELLPHPLFMKADRVEPSPQKLPAEMFLSHFPFRNAISGSREMENCMT